jgi:glutathione S-transferase
MDWQLASLNPPMTTMLIGYYRTPPDKRDATALESARREALRCWTIVERFIAGRQYLAGPELTLADFGNGILAHRWHNYPIERPELPNIKAWYQALSLRPGFREHILGPIA